MQAINAVRIEAQITLSRTLLEERAQKDIAVQQALQQARADKQLHQQQVQQQVEQQAQQQTQATVVTGPAGGSSASESVAVVTDGKHTYNVTWITHADAAQANIPAGAFLATPDMIECEEDDEKEDKQ